jgi:hypothetical protein
VAWLAFDLGWRRGGDEPVAWRDLTGSLERPAFPRQVVRVLETRAELEEFLREAMPGREPGAPAIDFDRWTAVLVTPGPRSSTGYGVDVASIVRERGGIHVVVEERAPRLGDQVEARVTFPYRLLLVPAGERVRVEWRNRAR